MLSEQRIIEIIKNPVNRQSLADGVSIQNEHKVHVTGEGYTEMLNKLIGFESDGDYEIRKQLTEPATKQLCAIILDNLNRWVSNQGTVKTVSFKQEKQSIAFKQVMNQVWRGGSMDSFIKTFYKEAIYQEMEGFLLVTKPKIEGDTQIREDVVLPYDKSPLNPYIIFISASDVHDFSSMGDNIEYLIIKQEEDKQKKFFRVIDDTVDMIVEWDEKKQTVTISDENIAYHGLDYVPAIQVSSIAKHLTNDKVKTSPIDHVLPALKRYMQKDSDLIIQMVRHMYPKLAAVKTECKTCRGDGFYYDKETKLECKDCGGTGKVVPISRDGIIGLPQYIDEGQTPYPGSPASYITPDNASLQIAIDDLKDLSKEILYSATGDKNLVVETLQTATENLVNYKGLEDRISDVIDMVESRESFLTKTVAKMHLDFQNGFKEVSIRYGRRLTIRGENEIMTEIRDAKSAGMPISHIEALQRELIYARYKNNKQELERQQLLADLEPLNGYTVDEVSKLERYVQPIDLKIKFNFALLVDNFESKNGPVQLYKPNQDWKQRVKNIYEKIKQDEILLIPGGSEGDSGQSDDGSEAGGTNDSGNNT